MALLSAFLLAACGQSGLERESDPSYASSAAASITQEDVNAWNATVTAGYLTAESDPLYAASTAASITQADVNAWNATVTAGYLTSESDPLYAASTAASITQADVNAWNATVTAGYLTSESDPLFAASVAAGITQADVDAWNATVTAGYLTAESDPGIGPLGTGYVPVWNGSALVNGAMREAGGKVGIGTPATSAQLTVGAVARFGTSLPTNAAKTCSIPGYSWTHTPASAGACNTYCANLGFDAGVVTVGGTRMGAGASCNYISNFETCAVGTMSNSGCDSAASSFICSCKNVGTDLSGDLRVLNGSVGIGVAAPSSLLELGGYLQLGRTAGAPPAADCDSAGEHGRMLVDPATGYLWICASAGWISK